MPLRSSCRWLPQPTSSTSRWEASCGCIDGGGSGGLSGGGGIPARFLHTDPGMHPPCTVGESPCPGQPSQILHCPLSDAPPPAGAGMWIQRRRLLRSHGSGVQPWKAAGSMSSPALQFPLMACLQAIQTRLGGSNWFYRPNCGPGGQPLCGARMSEAGAALFIVSVAIQAGALSKLG